MESKRIIGNKTVTTEEKNGIYTKLQVEERLSEDYGEYYTEFHYRVEKEAEAGIDPETGEYCAIHAKVSWEHKEPLTKERFQKIHQELYRKILAEQAGCKTDYITPISPETYAVEMGGNE